MGIGPNLSKFRQKSGQIYRESRRCHTKKNQKTKNILKLSFFPKIGLSHFSKMTIKSLKKHRLTSSTHKNDQKCDKNVIIYGNWPKVRVHKQKIDKNPKIDQN